MCVEVNTDRPSSVHTSKAFSLWRWRLWRLLVKFTHLNFKINTPQMWFKNHLNIYMLGWRTAQMQMSLVWE